MVFYLPCETGGGKRTCRSTGVSLDQNERKAHEAAREILMQYEGITYSEKAVMLLGEYVLYWINRERAMLRSTTYDNYLSILNRHIAPFFAERKLTICKIKPLHLQDYISKKMSEGLSPNTICKHITLIKSVLKDAYINELIKSNPADRVRLPRREKPQHSYYNADELTKLFNITKGTPIEIPVYIATLFGLRRSEVIGLKWSAIDFDKKTLSICGSVTRQQQQDGKWIDVYNDKLKSEASNSIYELNDYMCDYFKKLYEYNQTLISNTEDYKEYVCVNAIGERLKLDYVTHLFSKLLDTNGLKHIRFHDLRHSTLTILAQHFSMKAVQGYARHADFTITANTYCHVDTSEKLTELNKICNILDLTG